MSTKAIDYKIILKRDGQTQQQRMPQWLDPALLPVDDRTKEQFYEYLKSIAQYINYYDVDIATKALIVNGTWETFFNLTTDEINELAGKACLPPHIALWQSFMNIYDHDQKLMNNITQRHLDFYYGSVLRLSKNEPIPDKAHVLFELKKNATNTLIPTGASLLAGKDNTKVDLHYKLSHDIIVNASKVVQLKSLFVNPVNKNFIHHANVANSGDGLGGALDKTNPRWSAFGKSSLPVAQIGFCLAGKVLKMKEGDRSIKVTLNLKGLSVAAKNKALTTNLFLVSLTGEKGWIGPKTVSVEFTSADNLQFNVIVEFVVSKDESAVVEYDPAIHGHDFNTTNPLMQILINNEKSDFGYKDLLEAELLDATIEVTVNNLKDLELQNDLGSVDAKKPFFPFGPSPDVNANFTIKSEEAFTKRLKEFSINVDWKNIPATNLSTYFAGYDLLNNKNIDFTAMASFHDAFNWQGSQAINLFNSSNAKISVTWKFLNGAGPTKASKKIVPEVSIFNNLTAGLTVTQKISNNIGQLVPVFSPLKKSVAPKIQVSNISSLILDSLFAPFVKGWINMDTDKRTGRLTLSLQHSFLFKEYRKKYTEDILAFSKGTSKTLSVINEPFAPEIQSIKFNYVATTAKVSFNGNTLNSFIDEEVELFHYGAFGQMREHAYQKQQHSFLNNSIVKLLPQYKNEGEFTIGFSGLKAGDSACVLFQVAEGSADPDKPRVDINWSVLCDNYWKELTNEDFIFDTTNDLLTSGVIKFIIPPQATTINTILPTGFLWLKAAILNNSNAVCNLFNVQSNAAIAVFYNQGNDPAHLSSPLQANTINKLENEVGSIKSVKQPYATFQGKMQEDNNAFYQRVSERLRHKERSIALWDYERMVLQHFPQIHKVKCINHATETSYYEPGNVLVILVPDLTNQNAVNPLQPRVDKNTVDEVKTFIQSHSSCWVEHHVRNPIYEPVKISVTIKLKIGFEFNYYQNIIDQKLQQFLSPWVGNTASDIHFGGKVTKSMIVKLLEDLEFVDYITALNLQQFTGISFVNTEVAEASNPAAILVSADRHNVSNFAG